MTHKPLTVTCELVRFNVKDEETKGKRINQTFNAMSDMIKWLSDHWDRDPKDREEQGLAEQVDDLKERLESMTKARDLAEARLRDVMKTATASGLANSSPC
jgi:hypothetical protein